MRSHNKQLLWGLFFFLLMGWMPQQSMAYASDKVAKKVLLITSYHKGYRWTDEITRGVEDVLYPKDIDLHIEYMDTKILYNAPYLKLVAETLRLKYSSSNYDAVIFADDNAYDFAITYGREVFGNTPFVFCGLNYPSAERISKISNTTGVIEKGGLEDNINLITRLHPKCHTITVVTDNSTTGKNIQSRIRDIVKKRKDLKVKVNLLYDVSMDELKKKIRSLDDGNVILYTFFFRDKNNAFYEYDIGSQTVSEASKVPVHVAWEFDFGYGAVGGYMTTGYDQGKIAADLACQIVNGKSAAELPVLLDHPKQLRFDYRAMTRHGIPPNQLPKGSEVLFKPSSFYMIHKTQILELAGAFAFMLLALLGLCAGFWRSHITSQKLRRKEESLRTTLQSICEGVITTDTSGIVTRINEVAETQTGWSRAEAIGQPIEKILKLVTREDHQPLKNPVRNALANAESAENRLTGVLVSRKNTEILINISLARIYNDKQQTTGIVMVSRDITQDTLLQEQLRQSQKMEAIGQLAGGVAHDFNNMLGGIIGAAELLESHLKDNQQAKKFHRIILEASESATDLVSKLLAFSRKQVVGSTVIDVHTIINTAISLLRSSIDKRIEIKLNLTAECSRVVGDPSSIQSVILNLGINASHAMPEGGVISIDSEIIELDQHYCSAGVFDVSPGEYLHIEVRDTGSGISPEILPHIFEPFFTTKDAGKGTGLGLAAIYGIVQQHKGSISVYSEVGNGTSFHLYLPLVRTESSHMPKEQIELLHGSGCILVVDDELIMRTVAESILTDLGYEIVLAEDGVQALDLYRDDPGKYNLVLLDMVMPRMNGHDCFNELKEINPDVQVLLSSGFSREEDIQDMRSRGICGLIKKPYRCAVLSKMVYDIMHGHKF